MITKEGSTKIINFVIPGAGFLVLGRGHLSHNIVKMHYIVCVFVLGRLKKNAITERDLTTLQRLWGQHIFW